MSTVDVATPSPVHHPPPTKKRKPASRACQPCRELHKSCSAERPCQRCVKHGRAHLCVTPAPKPKRTAKMMRLTQPPQGVSPAITEFSSSTVYPPTVFETLDPLVDTERQIAEKMQKLQQLQLQLQQLRNIQMQQQQLRQNPPQYHFGVPGLTQSTSQSKSQYEQKPSVTHTPEPITMQATNSSLNLHDASQRSMHSLASSMDADNFVSYLTPNNTELDFTSSNVTLDLAEYSSRLDNTTYQLTLEPDTTPFHTRSLSSSGAFGAPAPLDFDPDSLLHRFVPDRDIKEHEINNENDILMKDASSTVFSNTFSPSTSSATSPVDGPTALPTTSTQVSPEHNARCSGDGKQECKSGCVNCCDDEVNTPGQKPFVPTIPRGPLSDADADMVVARMGALTPCIKLQSTSAPHEQQVSCSARVVDVCQQKIGEMMWRLADKTGVNEMTPEISAVLQKMLGVMMPKAALFDASAVPYASLRHKFKTTLQLASEMSQPVVLCNGRRLVYANDHFHKMTGNLFVDAQLYDFEMFHPEDSLKYLSFSLDKMSDKSDDTGVRFKVLSLAAPCGFVECIVNPHILFEQLTTMPLFSMINFVRVDV